MIEGVLHRFCLTAKGDVVTTGFYLPGAVITPHFARTIGHKSLFSLAALTEVLVAEIPVVALDALRHSDPEINAFGQRVVEAELTHNLASDLAHRSYTAKERLLLLRQTYPNLENLVPHPVIASYLGITPVSFSRLRSEMARS